MREYFDALKKSLAVFVIAFSFIIFPTFFELIEIFGKNKICYSLFQDLALLIGAIVTIIVINKEYKINIKSYIYKPDTSVLLNVILLAFFSSICTFYIMYRNEMGTGEVSFVRLIETFSGAIFPPIAEELVFRFGMLTILLTISNNSWVKKIVAAVFVTGIWGLIHFPDNIARVINLFIVGMILTIIYMTFSNIIYCIIFHAISNAVIYSIGLFCNPFKGMFYAFCISLALLSINIGWFIKNIFDYNKVKIKKFDTKLQIGD